MGKFPADLTDVILKHLHNIVVLFSCNKVKKHTIPNSILIIIYADRSISNTWNLMTWHVRIKDARKLNKRCPLWQYYATIKLFRFHVTQFFQLRNFIPSEFFNCLQKLCRRIADDYYFFCIWHTHIHFDVAKLQISEEKTKILFEFSYFY